MASIPLLLGSHVRRGVDDIVRERGAGCSHRQLQWRAQAGRGMVAAAGDLEPLSSGEGWTDDTLQTE